MFTPTVYKNEILQTNNNFTIVPRNSNGKQYVIVICVAKIQYTRNFKLN